MLDKYKCNSRAEICGNCEHRTSHYPYKVTPFNETCITNWGVCLTVHKEVICILEE